MAISFPSSTQSAGGAVWAQLQQQQAQRAADQAEQNARSLQVKAREAQTEASRAQEKARGVKVEYDQAVSEAGSAKQNLASLGSLGEVQRSLQNVRDQIYSSTLEGATGPANEPSGAGVLNASGQQTGTLINVTA